MKKIIVIGLCLIFVASALPILSAKASDVKSDVLVGKKSANAYDPKCVAQAIAMREDSIDKAYAGRSQAIMEGLKVRRESLLRAAQIPTYKERLAAEIKAHKDFYAVRVASRATMQANTKQAWATFNAQRAKCAGGTQINEGAIMGVSTNDGGL